MDMTGNKVVTYLFIYLFFVMLLDCKTMWHLENHKEGNLKPQKLLYFGRKHVSVFLLSISYNMDKCYIFTMVCGSLFVL